MAYRRTNIVPPDYSLIPGGLKIGAQVIIRGRVGTQQTRFHINLQNDKCDGNDIAFHFNPRTDAKTVVRNSFQGKWQTEEREIPFFPFANGFKFTIRIFVGSESYVVLVNGQNFIEFKHRLPLANVRYLKLSEGAEYYETTIQNPCHTPYAGEFPGGLKTGKALRVQGYVNENADGFSINFNTDIDGNIVGFHFDPRQKENVVVLNTKVDCWQKEERSKCWFPFQRGQYFDALFIASNDCFDVYVNEKFFISYKFRMPLHDILFLAINGDVTLMDVQFTDPLPCDYIKEIPSGLEKSDLIVTRGYFYPEGKRFIINLMYGTCVDNDVGLHFNPRRDENQVVLNSRNCGNWANEERHPLPKIFSERIPFEVEIVTKSKKFKTYINGIKFESFKARGKVEDIQGINVQGEAYIYEVKLLRRVETPFVDRLPGGLELGSWITVIGTPKKRCSNFSINLQCGACPTFGNDVAFHFNPNLSEQSTVQNTLQNGSWGKKERVKPTFPFKSDDRFEVNILRLDNMFRVFVNHKHYIDYTHRIDPKRITHVMLTGDCNFFEPEFFGLAD